MANLCLSGRSPVDLGGVVVEIHVEDADDHKGENCGHLVVIIETVIKLQIDDFDCDNDGDDDDDSDGDGDGYPLHEEHAAKAEEAAEEGNPGVEILERRTPPFEEEMTFFVWLCHLKTWALGDACMERGEVDECIGGDKEV